MIARIKEKAGMDKMEIDQLLYNIDTQERKELRQAAMAIVALETDQPFTAFTIDDFEDLFIANASCAELTAKLQSISATLEEIKDTEKKFWHLHANNYISVLLAPIMAEAIYLEHFASVKLPEEVKRHGTFKILFFQKANQQLRSKVAAMLQITGHCPFQFMTPEHIGSTGTSYWIHYNRLIGVRLMDTILKHIIPALRIEKRITCGRLTELVNERLTESKN